MIGETVDHYKIIEQIGQGGMGVVYKAQDLKLLRFVALKFLPPFFTRNDSTRKRFINEAQAASSLDHPNICTIHEINETPSGQLYIVMSFYEGESLNNGISRGAIPFSEAINLIYQIALGLNAAHSINIIHRDIKPANIMITNSGEVKILDFGLAKLDNKKVTKSIAPKGTVAYMSPRVILNQEIDQRTDLWSLGVVFYEMLTGHIPFEGKISESLMYSIVNEEPTPLSNYVTNVPDELIGIINKLLSRNKKDNYLNIEEFLDDLKPLLEKHISLELKVRSITSRISNNKKRNSVLLIPTLNQNSDDDQEGFSDAVTEDLTTKLANIGSLRVISKSTALKYVGTNKTPPEIAEETGVNFIVEFLPKKIADQVKIPIRIISAVEDEYIWAKEYDNTISNILIMQSQIAESIAKQIQGELAPEESFRISQSREVNPELYMLYTKGMFYLNKLTPEDVRKGLNYLQQAIEIDSTDPLPYAQLAIGYGHIAHSTAPDAIDALNKSGELATKALALDENLAEAHLALGMQKIFYEWDVESGLASYKKALEINPSFAYAHFQYAFLLALINNKLEGLNQLKTAKLLDPLSPFYPSELGWYYYFLKEYDKAIAEAELALELDPNFAFAYFVLGQAYMGKKMFSQAIEYQKKSAEKLFDWKWGLAQAYAQAGSKKEALEIVRELENRNSYWDTWCLAKIYVSLGDIDKAFFWLEEAYKRKHPYILWIKFNIEVVSLFEDHRFINLSERLNIQ